MAEEVRGGAIYNAGTLHALNCFFDSNNSTRANDATSGGAIASDGRISLVQCIFVGNSAKGLGTPSISRGNAVYLSPAADLSTMTNCTFAANNHVGATNDAAIAWSGANSLRTRIENCIVDEELSFDVNTSGQPGADELARLPVVRYCWVSDFASHGPSTGVYSVGCLDGSVFTNVGFVAGDLGDFRLTSDSVCIDHGNNTADTDDTLAGYQFPPATDYAGNARYLDANGDGTATIDIGAYEAQ